MILDHNEISEILKRLSKKIGVGLEEKVTVSELLKKVYNQNLCYQNESREINILTPSFKNSFFIKNAIVECKNPNGKVDYDMFRSAKMLNNKDVLIKDIYGNKEVVEYDGKNIVVKITREIPLDLYFKLLNG